MSESKWIGPVSSENDESVAVKFPSMKLISVIRTVISINSMFEFWLSINSFSMNEEETNFAYD